MGLLFQNFYMKHICRYLFCPNGSHMCMYDDQETYISGLIKFLKAVD
jgi:pimeloyl-ACP methyl ester carboxylesterase